jgi:two-component system invasion response regulator UvrY
MQNGMINIALADDHAVTRKGIKTILELNPELNVSIEASNGLELEELLRSASVLPDIVILDVCMPGMNGFGTIDMIKEHFPSVHILVFSLLCEEDTIINMITRGACGYIAKSADPIILTDAVLTIYDKGFYIGELTKKEYFRKKAPVKDREGFYGKSFLTAKEVSFIRLATTNLNYHEIADKMGVRPKTLENYRDGVFQKLGINNRAALALYAFRSGLVEILP